MIVPGFDCTHNNISHLPSGGVDAGYSTGTPDIKWTPEDRAAHPGSVMICQDAGATDSTADVLDVDRFAATNTEAAGWYLRALVSYHDGHRPGQRHPAIYTSADNVTPLVNALIAGGVHAGPGLFVANWNLSKAQAITDVLNAAGPFPIIGVQFTSLEFYDLDVFDSHWLEATSSTGTSGHVHLTTGEETLGQLAASRKMQPLSWVALQERLSPSDAARLLAASAPPAGLVWRSVNP